ncbi:MAG: hypothetical protein N2Z65_03485, partial [Clostridiales bacterium]|nr:hypothetical protein [Clostridiales bacterium]
MADKGLISSPFLIDYVSVAFLVIRISIRMVEKRFAKTSIYGFCKAFSFTILIGYSYYSTG